MSVNIPARLSAGVLLFILSFSTQANEWTGNGPEGGFTEVVAFDPANGQTVIAGTNGRLFRSLDGGVTWAPFNDFVGTVKIVFDPTNSDTIYSVGQGSTVTRLTNDGQTVEDLDVGASEFSSTTSID
ncbi:MAG: hypothetical protein MJA83_04010, partial [Gammaproteobacteria bacterium]|nr:hypothetical protein [Gammaproteobacteria bacterium]